MAMEFINGMMDQCLKETLLMGNQTDQAKSQSIKLEECMKDSLRT